MDTLAALGFTQICRIDIGGDEPAIPRASYGKSKFWMASQLQKNRPCIGLAVGHEPGFGPRLIEARTCGSNRIDPMLGLFFFVRTTGAIAALLVASALGDL